MRSYRLYIVLPFLALIVLPAIGDEPAVQEPIPRQPRVKIKNKNAQPPKLSDAEALKQAGMTQDEPGPLIEYLKTRTLTDADQSKIAEVIKRFADDKFDTRIQATIDVEKFGSAAIGPLKAAERDEDPEVAYRAKQTLKRLEKVPHSQVAAAAVRALVKLKPAEAVPTLLGFLPMADNEEVADVICDALIELAVADGKPDPALLTALDDKSVVRRGAAYIALIEGGDENERIRIKDAFPKVKAAIRKETDVDAKFRGLWSLLLTTREQEFVPDILEMIPKLPRGRIWQLEEFLLQLAGDSKPEARFGKSTESLTKAKDAWAAWWDKKKGSVDLVKFEFAPRISGFTDIIEHDPRGYGMFRIVTLGPDLKEKVSIGGGVGANMIQNPYDVKKLPNGNYLIAEYNNSRVTERDTSGKTIKTTNVTQPIALDLLPDGGLVVICANQVIQYDKDMKQQWAYARQQWDIMTGKRLPGGDVIIVTRQFQGVNCIRLGAKDGKEVGKGYTIGRIQQYQTIDVTGDEKILICEMNRVAEYDLKNDAKEVWKYDANNATSCQRLPNGNTLITLMYQGTTGRVYEVDTTGEVVWEYESKEGLRPARAFRR